jgi:hypothetical protein
MDEKAFKAKVEEKAAKMRAAGASDDVAATMKYSGTTAVLSPSSRLAPNTTYTATVAGTLADTSGNQLGSDVAIRCLVLTINRQGVVALWPLAMPDEDGRLHEWGRSALEAAEIAKTRWVRLRSNRNLGAYEVELATVALPDPVWPDIVFAEIVSVAFRGRVIDTADHPVVRALKGAM